MPTPTAYALLLQVCGLSHREAADFHDVRLDTVKSWSTGRNRAPDGALAELAELAARIDEAADEAVETIHRTAEAHGFPGVVDLGLAADDDEARLIGWPCVGAHRAVLAMTVARGMAEGLQFRIVPRGAGATEWAAIA
jgi:hypothetical protein